ncbi:peptidoglycan-binding domain-containing protein [Azospirillum sp. ST 5-10]|uniref:peptidoglycan-binding domain-containing protein n=1 Tax=unclassified Azospirillum TaxID=2630922 RepID=UPI003F4A6788
MRARRIILAAAAAGALSVSGVALAAGSSSMGTSADVVTTGVSPDTALTEIEVRDMQNALNNAGHEVTVDGRWGDETEAALSDFQRSQGLPVTGLPDKGTIAALEQSAGGSFSSNSYGSGGSAGPSVGTGTSGLTGMSGKSEAPSLTGREGEAVSGNSSGAVHPSTPDSQ